MTNFLNKEMQPLQRNVISIFFLFAFVLVTILLQTQASDIRAAAHRDRINTYDSCVARSANVERLNKTYQRLLELESKNPFVNAKIRAERAAIYSSAQISPVPCGDDPR